MSLSISPSPFGSLVVSVAETGSTLSVTTVATSPSVLSMALGVPGPKGDTGATGPAGQNGQNGTNGVGVPVGGTTGQALVKLSGTNYDTGWTTINAGGVWGSITGDLVNQTDLYDALSGKLSLSGGTMTPYSQILGSGNNFFINYVATDGVDPIGASAVLGEYNYFGNDYSFVGVLGDQISLGFFSSQNDSFIKFNDDTTQRTAFLPANYLSSSAIASTYLTQSSAASTYFPKPTGTTSQYIRGDGSLATYGPLGDRYLTTSTTSLTISNGAKTLTIGTGLSYSTQQDVTIAYDASNHMHATVTSYNSTTGVMVCDVYNKSGSGTYTSWTVNVGGVVGGSYLQTANNLSELTATASTARTNLGLGSMAVENTSSYLSSSAIASTYQTQSAMSAYLSTASASANYIGTSAYATTAQAVTGASTTTVISPSTFLDGKFYAGGKYVTAITWTATSSGTGANAFAQNANARYVNAPTTVTGYGIYSAILANNSRGSIYNSGFDFSKRIVFGARFARNVTTVDTNSIFRYSIGKSSSTDASDLSVRGLMIKVSGGGAMQLLVHNGTTLTTTTSSFTPANGQAYDVVVVSEGSGNVTLYVNGSSVATSTGGPTSAGSSNAGQLTFEVQNTATISSGQAQAICGSDFFVQVSP